MGDLKSILEKLQFSDDARVVEQLDGQSARVRDRLAAVRNTLLVMSGKGGVGKSTVTTQLALALARRGLAVGILDVDLNGPSVPHMLGVGERRLQIGEGEVEPIVGPEGIKLASMAFLLDESTPVTWKGPKELSHVWLGMQETGTLRELLGDVRWGALDVLLLDMPPGAAADKPPAVLQFVPDAKALLVTTSSAVARAVVERSRRYAEGLGLKFLGTVENLADLFASEDAGAPLARIPFSADLARSLDRGEPLDAGQPISQTFDALARAITEHLQ